MNDSAPDASQATVVATYSRRMALRLGDGSAVAARIKGRKIRPVCGDRVTAEPLANETDWLITNVADRDNALTRPDSRGRVEVLAANVSAVVVMAAIEPVPDWYIVDRYLAAAEVMAARGIVVFNKIDLGTGADVEKVLSVYAQCGYPVLKCSAASGEGLDTLAHCLRTETAVIVGQSGVGKSSVINELMDNESLRTGSLSAASREGRHTTVNSVMLDLPGGGAVIDSPGVRDYAPAIVADDDAAKGFREICKAGEQCRFANCRHLREPDCAVKAGVQDGTINERRYESYKRLANLARDLADKQKPG